MVVNGPFSVTLSWEVPSDDEGTSQPLSFTVGVINDTINLSFSTPSTHIRTYVYMHIVLYIENFVRSMY